MTDSRPAPLLARLAALFDADPLIDEIGLLFDVAEEDLTPKSAFVYAEHKLGVAFCAGVPLFRQARSRFHELNPVLAELHRHSGRDARPDEDKDALRVVSELKQCTRAILLISADFYTAWNTRKALVDLGYLDALEEIRFTNLVFTMHPKSIDTWAYRRWLAIRLIPLLPSGEAHERFLEEQIDVCERLAEQKPRNYHAWSFRHWVVTKFSADQELSRELKRMDKWCDMHITDHSGWNHRQHAVNQLMRRLSPDARSHVLREEYELLSRIMALYPTHEALWCHRRFIIHLVLRQYADQKLLTDQEVDSDARVLAVCQRIKDIEMQIASAGATSSTQRNPPPSATKALETNGMSSAALREVWWSIQCDLFGDGDTRGGQGASLTVSRLPERAFALVASVCVREIEVAWRCESKYARRYAAWCLERLRAWTDASRELDHSLAGLSTAFRKLLAVEDATLQDLWESNSASVGLH